MAGANKLNRTKQSSGGAKKDVEREPWDNLILDERTREWMSMLYDTLSQIGLSMEDMVRLIEDNNYNDNLIQIEINELVESRCAGEWKSTSKKTHRTTKPSNEPSKSRVGQATSKSNRMNGTYKGKRNLQSRYEEEAATSKDFNKRAARKVNALREGTRRPNHRDAKDLKQPEEPEESPKEAVASDSSTSGNDTAPRPLTWAERMRAKQEEQTQVNSPPKSVAASSSGPSVVNTAPASPEMDTISVSPEGVDQCSNHAPVEAPEETTECVVNTTQINVSLDTSWSPPVIPSPTPLSMIEPILKDSISPLSHGDVINAPATNMPPFAQVPMYGTTDFVPGMMPNAMPFYNMYPGQVDMIPYNNWQRQPFAYGQYVDQPQGFHPFVPHMPIPMAPDTVTNTDRVDNGMNPSEKPDVSIQSVPVPLPGPSFPGYGHPLSPYQFPMSYPVAQEGISNYNAPHFYPPGPEAVPDTSPEGTPQVLPQPPMSYPFVPKGYPSPLQPQFPMHHGYFYPTMGDHAHNSRITSSQSVTGNSKNEANMGKSP